MRNSKSEIIATEAALDTLDRRGEKPTQRRVIALLGGGSFSTVTRHCQTWLPKETPLANIGPVPESLAIQARQFVERARAMDGCVVLAAIDRDLTIYRRRRKGTVAGVLRAFSRMSMSSR